MISCVFCHRTFPFMDLFRSHSNRSSSTCWWQLRRNPR